MLIQVYQNIIRQIIYKKAVLSQRGPRDAPTWPMLGSPSAWALSYLAVILFSKYSNLCENHT